MRNTVYLHFSSKNCLLAAVSVYEPSVYRQVGCQRQGANSATNYYEICSNWIGCRSGSSKVDVCVGIIDTAVGIHDIEEFVAEGSNQDRDERRMDGHS